jgi:hypothetical protein
MTEHRRISNSETVDFLTCKRRYYNAYVRMLAPKEYSGPLSIGLVGHLSLERYFLDLKGGRPHPVARQNAERVLSQLLSGASQYAMQSVIDAQVALTRYFDYYGDHSKTWKIIEVERQYDLDIPGRPYMYSMKLDLLVYDLTDHRYKLVDNKFTYDFWSENKMKLRSQFPRYVAALRHNKLKVDEVLINQIRYRKMKDGTPIEKYLKRTPEEVGNHKIRMMLEEYISTADDITAFRALPPEEMERKAVRTLVDPICKYCPFNELCKLEMDGAYVGTMIKTDFVPNEYAAGYNPENPAKKLLPSEPSIEEQLEALL